MRKEDILEYVNRDWAAIERMKLRHWATQRLTPTEALVACGNLRDYALSLHPDWPTEKDRREDLANHIRVSESLRRVKLPGRG
jgi:hypothetical protein